MRCIVENKFGIVMSSWAHSPQRWEYISRCFRSLAKTDPGDHYAYLQLTTRKSDFDYSPYVADLEKIFWVKENDETDFVGRGIDPSFICSANDLILCYPEITHIVFMQDDFIFNPLWLIELDKLIQRHPVAKAYTVYKSSNGRHHRVLQTFENGDCLVTSIAGIGTVPREEWEEYNPDPTHGHGWFSVPQVCGGGSTLDLHHPFARPGERWATGKDYWENIGAYGSHAKHPIDSVDKALNFVGE